MPLFIGALLGALIQAAGTIAGRVLISLGIGFISFQGLDTSIVWAKSLIISNISATSANTIAAASAMKIGTCISILTSALTARLILNGLTGGTLKKLVYK